MAVKLAHDIYANFVFNLILHLPAYIMFVIFEATVIFKSTCILTYSTHFGNLEYDNFLADSKLFSSILFKFEQANMVRLYNSKWYTAA